MGLLSDIARYVARPEYRRKRDPISISLFVNLIGLNFFLAFSAGIFGAIVYGILNVPDPEVTDSFRKYIRIENFFVIAMLVPFIEELLFRSWLGFRLGILILLPVAIITILMVVMQKTNGLHFLLVVPTLIAIWFYCVSVWRERLNHEKLDRLIGRFFPIVFWFTASIFGLIHLSNFSAEDAGFLAFLKVLPQTVSGFVFGYSRMRFGFLTCVGLHSAHNGILLLVATMAQQAVS